MEMSGITLLRASYGIIGLIAWYKARKIYTVKLYMKKRGDAEDSEDVRAVNRAFYWWYTPLWLVTIALLFTRGSI